MTLFLANALLRFVLEMAAVAAIGYWGFVTFSGPVAGLFGLGLPTAALISWGVFRVPNDGGPPMVEVHPRVRLLLEAVVFAGALAALWAVGQSTLAWIILAGTLLNYVIDWKRTLGFLAGRVPETNALAEALGQKQK